MIPTDWIPHRRDGDRELVGYLVMVAQEFQPMTVFGHPLSEPTDYLEAEEILETQGMACLGEQWRLTGEGGGQLVRIVECTSEKVVLADDDFGQALAIGTDIGRRTELPVPTDRLERAHTGR